MRRHTLPALAVATVVAASIAGCDLIDGSAGHRPPGSGGVSSGGLTSAGTTSGGTTLGGTTSDGTTSSGTVTGGSESPPSLPSAEESYAPDATGEVVGTNCQYDQNTLKIKFDLSIQNVSTTRSFVYNIHIDYAGGDNAFSQDSFGSESQTVTVGPGLERKITVTHGYELDSTKRQYYGCKIRSATKSPVS